MPYDPTHPSLGDAMSRDVERKMREGIEIDTIKQIVEDIFLLAHNIREGDLDEMSYVSDENDSQEIAAMREYRTVELVIGIGERLARTAGISDDDLWKPDSLRDMIDAS